MSYGVFSLSDYSFMSFEHADMLNNIVPTSVQGLAPLKSFQVSDLQKRRVATNPNKENSSKNSTMDSCKKITWVPELCHYDFCSEFTASPISSSTPSSIKNKRVEPFNSSMYKPPEESSRSSISPLSVKKNLEANCFKFSAQPEKIQKTDLEYKSHIGTLDINPSKKSEKIQKESQKATSIFQGNVKSNAKNIASKKSDKRPSKPPLQTKISNKITMETQPKLPKKATKPPEEQAKAISLYNFGIFPQKRF